MTEAAVLILILFCLALEALFSGGEIALIAADIHLIRQKAESGSRSAGFALKLLRNPEWFFSTCLTGTDLCIVTGTALATSLFIGQLGPGRGEWVAVLVMVPVILLFGEIVPKSFFRQRAEEKAAAIAPFIWVASWVLYPLVFAVSTIARAIVYVLAGERGRVSLPYITKDGLKHLLQEEVDRREVKSSEREMVDRIFDFSETRAADIMVPVSNMAALDIEARFRDAVRLMNETGFSRFPVYQGNVINIVGVVNAFDILKDMPQSAELPIRTALRQILFVPSSKAAGALLLELQRKGEPIAAVVDEYGGALGIVTTEDILEEVVGDIRDEYDKRERAVRKLAPGRYLVNARIGIERLKEIVPVSLPEGPYETLAGYLLHQMGRVPKRMDQYRAGAIQFVIEDADMKSIKQVQLIVPEKEPQPDRVETVPKT